MPPPFEERWRGIKCYPCPYVCPSVIKIWCPLNNFWKTASIQFKFGMLIVYNIKTQVKFEHWQFKTTGISNKIVFENINFH